MAHPLELIRQQAEANAPPGRLAARFLLAMARARGDYKRAARLIGETRWVEGDKLRAAITAVDTTDNAAALRPIGESFFAALRPMTLIGRIHGMREVPPNVKNITAVSGSAGTWIKEGDSVPVSKQVFSDRPGLGLLKIAAMTVATEELIKHSSAEQHLLDDLAQACAAGIDSAFIDPANPGVSGTRPASVTNAGMSQVSSGDAADDLDYILQTFSGDLSAAVFVTHPRTALQLGIVLAPAAEALGSRGGHLMTSPVVTSESVPFGTLSLIDPQQIEITNEGTAELSVSQHADIQMDDSPTMDSSTPTDGELVSLWQANAIGLMGICYANWRLVRTAGVVSVTSADYLPGVTG